MKRKNNGGLTAVISASASAANVLTNKKKSFNAELKFEEHETKAVLFKKYTNLKAVLCSTIVHK